MRARTAFLSGWAAANALERAAKKVAYSDTGVGRETLRKLVSRMDHDHLLRLRKEVENEVTRRRRVGRESSATQ